MFRRDIRRIVSQVVNGLALGGFLWLSSGAPLPAPTPASGELFPCMNCGCGCATAEHCWRNCCCHTPAERLAWAKRNGVKPPTFVLAAAAEEVVRKTAPAKPCCPHCVQAKTPVANSTKPANTKQSFITVWQALKCHGHSPLAATPLCVAPPAKCIQPPVVVVTWVVPQVADKAIEVALLPELPPPEVTNA
jgi:hypothetical protein